MNLLNGYNDIKDYSDKLIQISNKLNYITEELEKDLGTNLREGF